MSETEDKEIKEYFKWCEECCSEYCGDKLKEYMGDELCPGCLCSEYCEEIRNELGLDDDGNCEDDGDCDEW